MISPLLRRRTFRRFWIGQSVSLLGDQISLFAIAITAVLLLHAQAAQMGLLTAAGLIPSLLFSLHAGAWIDRIGHRRQVMLACDAARALLMASIPIAYALGTLTLGQLYAVAFTVGIFDVLFSVAYQSLFVAVVAPADYVAGQALLNGSRAGSLVAGQGAAGLLIAAVSAPGAIVVDACSFLVSAFTLARITPAEPPPARPGPGAVGVGLRFIRGSRVIRPALASTTTVNFFTFAFSAIFVLYATRSLHLHPAVLGFVLGAGALGSLLASALTGRIAQRVGTGRTYAIGSLLFPAPLVLVPLAAGPHWLVLGALVCAEFGSGAGVMMLDIGLGALFAAAIPNELRARVAGAYRMINYGIRPLGALAGGALGAAIGLRAMLWVSVAGASCCVLWLLGSPVLARANAAPAGAAEEAQLRPA